MTDLKIDYYLLEDSSSSLKAIYDCFDHLESRASATESDWGSSDIKGAMGDFSGDWDHHRHEVMKSVDSVKQTVDQALDGFRKTDEKLASSLDQQRSTSAISGSGGGRTARAQ